MYVYILIYLTLVWSVEIYVLLLSVAPARTVLQEVAFVAEMGEGRAGGCQEREESRDSNISQAPKVSSRARGWE